MILALIVAGDDSLEVIIEWTPTQDVERHRTVRCREVIVIIRDRREIAAGPQLIDEEDPFLEPYRFVLEVQLAINHLAGLDENDKPRLAEHGRQPCRHASGEMPDIG